MLCVILNEVIDNIDSLFENSLYIWESVRLMKLFVLNDQMVKVTLILVISQIQFPVCAILPLNVVVIVVLDLDVLVLNLVELVNLVVLSCLRYPGWILARFGDKF